VLIFSLPESPRFLARRPERWRELSRLLERMLRPTEAEATFSDQAEQKVEVRKGFAALFSRELVRDSLALWCAFFMCLLTVYSAFSWLPTMLVSAGLSGAVASSGLTAYNLGGVLGAIGCALAITRFGSRWPLLTCCAGAAASAFGLRYLDFPNHTMLLIFGLGVHGLFVNAVQSTMFALCAYVYPTAIRATGAASGLAFGRLGAVLSGLLGAEVIAAGGSSSFLWMLGGAMLLVLVALASVRHHIPVLSNVPTPVYD
jgi:AAHS family 4-hydroxybenzoate transporter-like MFS transporter